LIIGNREQNEKVYFIKAFLSDPTSLMFFNKCVMITGSPGYNISEESNYNKKNYISGKICSIRGFFSN
jgi:hypothetical protein